MCLCQLGFCGSRSLNRTQFGRDDVERESVDSVGVSTPPN